MHIYGSSVYMFLCQHTNKQATVVTASLEWF